MTTAASTKHPATARLANEAFVKSACQTHQEFCDLFGGAIGLRTLRAWLKGEQPAAPLTQLMLREFVAGWRPSRLDGCGEDA